MTVVKLHNADTIHSEIVALCDVQELLDHARAEGEIEFAGLGEYEAQHDLLSKSLHSDGGKREKKSGIALPDWILDKTRRR